ncbi:hypothetical protein Q0Q72_12185 [Escherichia coli O13:H15]
MSTLYRAQPGQRKLKKSQPSGRSWQKSIRRNKFHYRFATGGILRQAKYTKASLLTISKHSIPGFCYLKPHPNGHRVYSSSPDDQRV